MNLPLGQRFSLVSDGCDLLTLLDCTDYPREARPEAAQHVAKWSISSPSNSPEPISGDRQTRAAAEFSCSQLSILSRNCQSHAVYDCGLLSVKVAYVVKGVSGMQQTLTVLQLALLARRVREHPDQLSHVLREPIAIVGMGCRFPGGVQTPQDFWQLLRQGRDAVSTRAADRSRLGVDQVTSSSPVTIAARVIDRPRALDPKRQVRSDRLPSRPPFASTRL